MTKRHVRVSSLAHATTLRKITDKLFFTLSNVTLTLFTVLPQETLQIIFNHIHTHFMQESITFKTFPFFI